MDEVRSPSIPRTTVQRNRSRKRKSFKGGKRAKQQQAKNAEAAAAAEEEEAGVSWERLQVEMLDALHDPQGRGRSPRRATDPHLNDGEYYESDAKPSPPGGAAELERVYKIWSAPEVKILRRCCRELLVQGGSDGVESAFIRRKRPNYKEIQERLRRTTGGPRIPISKIRDKFRRIRIDIEESEMRRHLSEMTATSEASGTVDKPSDSEYLESEVVDRNTPIRKSAAKRRFRADSKVSEGRQSYRRTLVAKRERTDDTFHKRGRNGSSFGTRNSTHRRKEKHPVKRQRLKGPEDLLFEMIDLDQDGVVDHVDLCSFAVSENIHLTRQEVQDLMRSASYNADGEICDLKIKLKDFRKALKDPSHHLYKFFVKTSCGYELLGGASSNPAGKNT